MTELAQGDVQSQSTLSSAPVDTSTSVQQSAPVERTFKQSEVNDLIGRSKHEAVERYKRESSLSSHQPQTHTPQPSYQAQNASQTDYLETMRRIASEEGERAVNAKIQEVERFQHEKQAKAVAENFFAKVDQAKSKYQDFDSVMQGVNYGSIPNTVANMMNFDNSEDMLYALGKNPLILDNLERAASERPELAMAELRRLSQALKNNQHATQYQSPNEPLSQLRPTSAGAEKSGPLTASDYRRKYRV